MAGQLGLGKGATLGLSARGMRAGQVRPGGLLAAERKGEENRFKIERRRGKGGGKEHAKRNARAVCSLAFRRLLHKPNCDGEPAGEEVGFCVMLCCVATSPMIQAHHTAPRVYTVSTRIKNVSLYITFRRFNHICLFHNNIF